jgi:hypothetical protein
MTQKRRIAWVGSPAVLAEIKKLGKLYVGIVRPKGYRRQWRMKDCFRNASELALRGGCTYVEGLAISAISPRTKVAFHHAWITLDGIHAVDTTWKDAPDTYYFGVSFTLKQLADAMVETGYYGSLLDPARSAS